MKGMNMLFLWSCLFSTFLIYGIIINLWISWGRFSSLGPTHTELCPGCLSYLPALSLFLSFSPSPPFSPCLPINEAADIPDLLSQLLQDLFFVTNLQQLESRGMHVNFVCVIWWQVRLNQAPSGWMRGAQGSGIWGAEWWTGSGQGGRHKALFVCINMLYSSSGRHTDSQQSANQVAIPQRHVDAYRQAESKLANIFFDLVKA